MVSMSTQLLFGLLLLLLFGWCDVCVVVCVCFPSSKYRYKAMVNAKVEYMYMTQLKASVLSSGAMTIWLWSLVANNYSKLPGSDAARFFGARCGTPCHAMPRFDKPQGVPRRFENVAWRGTSENFGATRGTPRAMSCHVYPKTWHGVALHTMPRATSCHVLITLKSPFYCRKSTKT